MARHQLGRPQVSQYEVGGRVHRVADVQPLDVDGVTTMVVGTIIWAVAAVALLPFWGTLSRHGQQWWLWSAVAGAGLGLIGIEYCRWRRSRLQQAEAIDDPEATAILSTTVTRPPGGRRKR